MCEYLNCKFLSRVNLWFHPNFYRNLVLLILVCWSDLACAGLVWLSVVKFAVVSISINQSSNCVESFPLKIVISWSRVLANVVFFGAVHNVSVYCWRTSSIGSDGAEEWSAKDSLWSSCSRWLIASVGWFLAASTLCFTWSSSFVNSFNYMWFSCSIFSKSSISSW